jgi:hypothetical protein
MRSVCLICASHIAAEELYQHLTGDYHQACFDSISAAMLRVEHWGGEGAPCRLCGRAVAPHAVVVMPGDFVVHLRCFFDPPHAGRRSLGAGAWTRTPRERGAALCRYARVLHRMVRRTRARAYVLRAARRGHAAPAD